VCKTRWNGSLRHEGRRLADDEHDNDHNQHERDVVVLRLTTVLAPHLQPPASERLRCLRWSVDYCNYFRSWIHWLRCEGRMVSRNRRPASERFHLADESNVETGEHDQRQQQHEDRVADVAVDDVVQATEAERRVDRLQPRGVVQRVDLQFDARLGELGRVVQDGERQHDGQLYASLSYRAQSRCLHQPPPTDTEMYSWRALITNKTSVYFDIKFSAQAIFCIYARGGRCVYFFQKSEAARNSCSWWA